MNNYYWRIEGLNGPVYGLRLARFVRADEYADKDVINLTMEAPSPDPETWTWASRQYLIQVIEDLGEVPGPELREAQEKTCWSDKKTYGEQS